MNVVDVFWVLGGPEFARGCVGGLGVRGMRREAIVYGSQAANVFEGREGVDRGEEVGICVRRVAPGATVEKA